MNNIKFITVLDVVTALFTVSCSDDDSNKDTQKATITLITPQDEQVFEAGEQIHVQANLTDNLALASYKIDIHYAGDGHQHRTLSVDENQQLAHVTRGSRTGTSDTIHIH